MRDIIRLKSFGDNPEFIMDGHVFIPPVFIAYGVSYNAPLNYYITVFAAFMMFILITAGSALS